MAKASAVQNPDWAALLWVRVAMRHCTQPFSPDLLALLARHGFMGHGSNPEPGPALVQELKAYGASAAQAVGPREEASVDGVHVAQPGEELMFSSSLHHGASVEGME